MEEFDTIIIGSGAGGLAAAICLARAGQKILVLEQHDVPGGWCHSFHIKGQRFSPGVHYVGLLEEGQSSNQLYTGLGVANDLVFFRMNTKAYEHCLIGDDRFDFPAGIENLYRSLAEKFPQEKKGLKKYLKLVEQVSEQLYLIPKMKGFWDHLTIPFRTRYLGKYGLFSLKRVIDWHIKDPLLKGILNIQCGDHGLPPGQVAFPVHCAVMSHYFEGACYPMGGGAGIVKAMTNTFKRHGGEIKTGKKVKKILIENKQAYGIELETGEQYFAKNVISNADPTVTYLQLAGKENLSNSLIKKLQKTRYSVTSVILFLTLDMDVRAAGMDSGNIWMMKDKDMEKTFREMTRENILEDEEFPAVFISCTTLKDPVSYNGRYHNFEVVTFLSYDSFKEFEGLDDYHGERYSAFKTRISEKLINSLEKVLPGANAHVVQMELGTPKTNEYYINSTRGNVYGTEKTLSQVGPFAFSNKSEIKNLFLCGASTLSHGVGGATNSGVATAARILNCRAEDLLIPDENQHIRIYDAEDPQSWPDWVHQKINDKKRRFTPMEDREMKE